MTEPKEKKMSWSEMITVAMLMLKVLQQILKNREKLQ